MGSMEKKYAEALLSMTEDAPQADKVGDTLNALGQLLTDNAELRRFVLNPSIPGKTRGETLFDVLDMLGEPADGECCVLLSRFLKLLLDKGRLAFLPDIADEYKTVKLKHRDFLRVIVRSVSPLDVGALEDFREKYRVRYGAAEAEVENVIQQSIPGGVRVQIGGVHIDDTVCGRLAELARVIAAGAVYQS